LCGPRLGPRITHRLAPGPSWWRRVDPILDVLNVLAVIGFFLTTIVLLIIHVN